ncbi:hypothetical protein HGM15179_003195, partial [Zosterops borbonicus]
TEQTNCPNSLSFNSSLSSWSKNAVSKDLVAKRTFLCLTGFLEQASLKLTAAMGGTIPGRASSNSNFSLKSRHPNTTCDPAVHQQPHRTSLPLKSLHEQQK